MRGKVEMGKGKAMAVHWKGRNGSEGEFGALLKAANNRDEWTSHNPLWSLSNVL